MCTYLTPVHSALPQCYEWNIIYWGYKCENCCCLSFAHQTDPTPKIFSVVAQCSLAGYATTFQSTCPLHYQGDGGSRFLSDDVTYPLAYNGWTKMTSNIIVTTLRTSHLNKSLKFWPKSDWYVIVNSDIFYVWVVWIMSGVSVNKSEGVTVCLWLRSELLTAVTCLPCWDVTPCSLIALCQDCNWAQGNQI